MTLLVRYYDSYANNQFRALQQFFKWHATEDHLPRAHIRCAGPRSFRAMRALISSPAASRYLTSSAASGGRKIPESSRLFADSTKASI